MMMRLISTFVVGLCLVTNPIWGDDTDDKAADKATGDHAKAKGDTGKNPDAGREVDDKATTPAERRIKVSDLLGKEVSDKENLSKALEKLDDNLIDALQKCMGGGDLAKCGLTPNVSSSELVNEILNSQKEDDDLFKFLEESKKNPSADESPEMKAALKELKKRAENYPGLNEIHKALGPGAGSKMELYKKLIAIQKADPSKPAEWKKAHQIAAHLITSMKGDDRRQLQSELDKLAAKNPNLAHFRATLGLSEHMRTGGSIESFKSEYLDKNPEIRQAAIQSRKDEIERARQYHADTKLAAENPDSDEGKAATQRLKDRYSNSDAEAWRLGRAAKDKTEAAALIATTPKDSEGNLVFTSLIRPASLPPLPGDPEKPRPSGVRPGAVHIAVKPDAESVAAFGSILGDKYNEDLRPSGGFQKSNEQRELIEAELKTNGGKLGDAITKLSKDSKLQKQFGTDEAGLKKFLTSAADSSFVGKYNPDTKEMEWVQTDLSKKYAGGQGAPPGGGGAGGDDAGTPPIKPKPDVKPDPPKPDVKPDPPKPDVKPDPPKPDVKPDPPKPDVKPDPPKPDPAKVQWEKEQAELDKAKKEADVAREAAEKQYGDAKSMLAKKEQVLDQERKALANARKNKAAAIIIKNLESALSNAEVRRYDAEKARNDALLKFSQAKEAAESADLKLRDH